MATHTAGQIYRYRRYLRRPIPVCGSEMACYGARGRVCNAVVVTWVWADRNSSDGCAGSVVERKTGAPAGMTDRQYRFLLHIELANQLDQNCRRCIFGTAVVCGTRRLWLSVRDYLDDAARCSSDRAQRESRLPAPLQWFLTLQFR